ncbi:uncharacterized protein LOC111374276 [Olea europaea var. sylvestris]|uniref:Uncharacterized protein LOC111374276 n=1 Tax=Olea europaea subsp. europaea TaxID=158383 RepID=A0A8S0SZ51_OLEEU|nr:uncharacterized protein LOC111374276 [Olea europaea var. sylvestris]CAA2996446.1 uncharacterized protein LOC111374276 [Olea europaea subsp. europaea]
MAYGWMKALQCKSRAADDVHHHRRRRHQKDYDHHSNPKNHQYHHLVLLNSVNCRNSVQNLRDRVENEITKHKKPKQPKQPQTPPSKGPVARKSDAGTKQFINKTSHGIISNSGWLLRATDLYFPAITELQEGHPSRNVVEIIFHTSWGPKNFPGRIEMVFKVQNLARTVTRFEEYREVVKCRARSRSSASVNGSPEDHARCVADGNEVMRFHCLRGSSTTTGAYDGGSGGACAFHGEQKSAICTFSETGSAHESAGGGRGGKAMLVCRVIAGRVCKQLKFDSLLEGRVEYDSMSGENGEFIVFDSRALLPCFLVIYKL